MKSKLNKLFNSGVTTQMNSIDIFITKSINRMSIFIVIYCLFDLLCFPKLLTWEDFVINPLVIIVLLSFVYLNSIGKQKLSRTLFHIFIPLMLGLVIATYGIAVSSAEIFFIPGLIMAFFDINKSSQQNRIVIWYFLCFVTGVFSALIFGPIAPVSPLVEENYLLIIFGISISIILCRTFINVTHEYVNTVESLSKKLENQNKDLKNFTYAASHDLKTPVRTIMAFQQLMVRETTQYNNEKLNEYLRFAIDGAEQMNEILQDLLKFATLSNENQLKNFEEINLKSVLEQIILETEYSKQFTNEKITIEGYLPTILGVKSQLKLMLQNLIYNGLKYNESAEPEVIISSYENEQKNEIIIKIKDNGIGIDAEYHQQIFAPFKRLHTNRIYQGTGFGLAITQRIVDNLNGKIEIISKKGQGSEFLVFLKKSITSSDINNDYRKLNKSIL